DPGKAEVEGRRVPVAKLTLREILVASERTSDGFDGRVANPEIIVNRRSRMNLAVIGEDEQIGPRDAKQVPEMLDQWRQCRLKTRGVEFVQPPGAVASFERVGVGSTQLREVGRPAEIVHRQPHVWGA